MLFNSYIFIFAFLPVVLLIYFFLGKTRWSRMANVWLLVVSLFFYGYWDIHYLPLLVGSILVNYIFSSAILALRHKGELKAGKIVFLLGIFFNLCLLGYYKYLNFLLDALNGFIGSTDSTGTSLQIILPLGISFFSITQILALVDCHEGVIEKHNILDYALFVSFFPHLMAGPILYHKQMMNQFQNRDLRVFQWNNFTMGLVLFILGLAKKLLIADTFIAPVTWGYDQVGGLRFFAAWFTVICYAFELYFDFSGYSDMAVGLARMMNLTIPINFNRPFLATSIANFWQRWHISLTNAITACVYIPLVRVLAQKHDRIPNFWQSLFAASVAFFLVGIWHGAGWTFVAFAFLQSFGIAVCMLWKRYGKPLPKWLAHIATLGFIAVSFTIFRAPDMIHAKTMILALVGCHGFDLPQAIFPVLTSLGQVPELPALVLPTDVPLVTFFVAVFLVSFCPDVRSIVKRIEEQPHWYYAPIISIIFFTCVLSLTKTSLFLYFQF